MVSIHACLPSSTGVSNRASMAIAPKLRLAAAPSRQGLTQLQQGANQLLPLTCLSLSTQPPNSTAVKSHKSTPNTSLSIESPEPTRSLSLALWPSSILAQSSAFRQLEKSAPRRRENTPVARPASYCSFCCSSPKLASAPDITTITYSTSASSSQHIHTYAITHHP
jgi:hypothetical protein